MPRASSARTDFQRDFDRVVFSSAFRRMQDKTQVFPLSKVDYVRTRLTHSLESSSVGRSLGTLVGVAVLEYARLGDRLAAGVPLWLLLVAVPVSARQVLAIGDWARIDPADRERVFEPFYRTDASRDRRSGGAERWIILDDEQFAILFAHYLTATRLPAATSSFVPNRGNVIVNKVELCD